MKKITFSILFISFFVNSVISQNQNLKSLVEKANELNLDMVDLTTFAEKNISDKEQLAKFFYYWIGSNIEYDTATFSQVVNGDISNEDFWKSQSESVVYENRKGVCAGYANLYKWFLESVNIETVVVPGYIRDERNHYIELNSDDIYRHAWNAVKLNNKWILVDTTWGTSEEKETADFYFDINPRFAIFTHFPQDSKWQLLKEPLSLEEFNKSQFVKPIWFIVGFTDVPKLMIDKKYYYYVFQDIPENKWSVSLKFSNDNINFKPIKEIKVIDQDGFTYFRFDKAQIPEKAFFKVKIGKFENLGNEYQKMEYDNVINFKI